MEAVRVEELAVRVVEEEEEVEDTVEEEAVEEEAAEEDVEEEEDEIGDELWSAIYLADRKSYLFLTKIVFKYKRCYVFFCCHLQNNFLQLPLLLIT